LKSALSIEKKFEEMLVTNFYFKLSNFVVIYDEKCKLLNAGPAKQD